MSYHQGPPSWVSRQREDILKAEAMRTHSELADLKSENARLKADLEETKEKLSQCEKRLRRRKREQAAPVGP